MSTDTHQPTPMPAGMAPSEWRARVDLAVAYRAAAHYGWNDTIYNHFTHRVPEQPDCFLVKRHAHTFDEVTASSLIKVDLNGRALSFEDDVNPAAFAIHTAILSTRPEVNATLHLHTPVGMALSARPEGFLYLYQEAAFFHDRISYHHYDGIEERPDDAVLLAKSLAAHHHTLILRNHGVATAAENIQGAFVRMQQLMTCAKAQLLACAPASQPQELPAKLCQFTRDQYEAQTKLTEWKPEWQALCRMVHKHLPGCDQ